MKKQIAVLMAAATAVTTVAPVLANADTNTYSSSVSEANAKIKAALNERYKNKTEDGIHEANADAVKAYMNSRYVVALVLNDNDVKANPSKYDVVGFTESEYGKAATNNVQKAKAVKQSITDQGVNLNDVYIVKDAGRVQGLLEKNVIGVQNSTVKVIIIDKGIKDGSALQTLTQKHYVEGPTEGPSDPGTEETLNATAQAFANNIKVDATSTTPAKEGYVKDLKVDVGNTKDHSVVRDEVIAGTVTKIKVTLTSGKEYTLEVNDKAFNTDKAVDAKGNQIDLTKANAQNVLDQVEGFEYMDNEDNKSVTLTLPLGDTDIYDVQDVQASVIELGKIFTNKDGYTKEGADLVNAIVKSREAKEWNKTNTDKKLQTFNFRGVNYEFLDDVKDPAPQIEKVGEGYVLKYTIEVNDLTNEINNYKLQFVVKGDSQKDLSIVLKDLGGYVNGKNGAVSAGHEVVAGKFTRLEGANRYATAVAISAERFDPQEASTVVIAGGEALMDGLSAVPLATAHNAPILLANPKTGLDKDTLNEIKRACKNLNRKTVYIVGGENSVPSSVVKQLEDEFGATVQRLSGSDRFETSLDVARNIKTGDNSDLANNNIFVVGGNGAADAMSISPVAGKLDNSGKVSPILVVPQDGLKKTTRDFVKGFSGDVTIIGGESTVSPTVYRTLQGTNSGKVTRVSGSDRFDTNVQIIEQYYTKDSKSTTGIYPKGLIVASGDNKFLVDAQTAGPLAVNKNAAILLAGTKLTDDQINLIKEDTDINSTNGLLYNGDVKGHVYKVGGVVSADVMSVVVDKLGL